MTSPPPSPICARLPPLVEPKIDSPEAWKTYMGQVEFNKEAMKVHLTALPLDSAERKTIRSELCECEERLRRARDAIDRIDERQLRRARDAALSIDESPQQPPNGTCLSTARLLKLQQQGGPRAMLLAVAFSQPTPPPPTNSQPTPPPPPPPTNRRRNVHKSSCVIS